MGGLFSGIGGFELAATRLGIDVRWMCEIEPYCQKVLARHWPGVPVYGDIKGVDFDAVEPVDLLTGGPPCQPVSVAGERRGEADDRWLWPEVWRVDDGISAWLDGASIPWPYAQKNAPNRVARVKALGNSVLPQCAAVVLGAILVAEGGLT